MKTTKLLLRCALGAAVLAAFGLVGCTKVDLYSVDAPADLQHKIDSIEAAKPNTGDTTYLTIATPIVGAEDNTSPWNSDSPWNGAHSDFFTIPANKLLVMEFINYGSEANNWNNWNLAVDVVKANSADYDPNNGAVGYFTIRSDAWGWGNSDFNLSLLHQDYPDTDGDGDIWNDFRKTMQGAYVTIEIDHSVTGNVFVTATAVGTNGTTLTETYQQPVSATDDIVAYLVCDASHFEMKKAYLIPSKVTEVADVNPASITIEGAPTAIELGDSNFWGNAKATVTFEDGSSTQVDSADLSFTVIPDDMSALGAKTVIVTYSKTKQGNYTNAVSTYYTFDVTNAVTALEITTLPDVTAYTFPGPTAPMFDPTGMVVTATYSDGTSGVISNDNLQFEIPVADGAQDAIISYVGAVSTVTTTCPITNVLGTNTVGAADNSTAWWTVFSNNYEVASGDSVIFTMHCYSSGANNWDSPSTILRRASVLPTDDEYAVVRMDNFGWGTGYSTAVLTSDWDWNTFTANIDNSDIKITVTNVGDGTANIRYDVTYANGDKHYQLYKGITVDSSDLSTALVLEAAHIEITSVQ